MDFNPVSEGSKYQYIVTNPNYPSNVTLVLGSNPNRVSLIVSNASNTLLYLYVGSTFTVLFPTFMVYGGETRIFTWEDCGGLITQPVRMQNTAANGPISGLLISAVSFTEVIYKP